MFKLSFYGHTLPAAGMHFFISAMVNDSADSKTIFFVKMNAVEEGRYAGI